MFFAIMILQFGCVGSVDSMSKTKHSGKGETLNGTDGSSERDLTAAARLLEERGSDSPILLVLAAGL